MKKKILPILCIFICIIYFIMPKAYATEIKNADIYYEYECDWVLQFLNPKNNVWTYVRTFYTVYNAPNGQKYPTYCLNSDKSGVGGLKGEYTSYTVSIEKQLEDDRIWRIITNGYPYKTPSELGLDNESDAFTATKHAIYSVLYDRDIRNYYRPSQKSEELRMRGEKVLGVIEKLVDIGKNGTDTRINGNVTIKKSGDLKIENDKYYSQEFSVNSNCLIKEYEVAGIKNFPEGSLIVNLENESQERFNADEKFKVLIPIDKVKESITGDICVQGECKTYPIFYGDSKSKELQNYAICYDLYGSISGVTTFTKQISGKVSIKKVAKENNIWTSHKAKDGVAGAKYELKNSKGEQINIFTSDKEGILVEDYELSIGEYTLKEISSPQYFEKDEKEHKFSIKINEEKLEIELKENVKKGGYVTIQKTSENKNFWNGKEKGELLQGAVYQIKNKNQEILYEITTNENGTIEEPLKLEVGNYTIQEIIAPEFYILDNTIYEFKIDENEQLIELKFKNQSKETPKLPKTGF